MTENIKNAKDFLIKETYCKFNKGDCDLDCGVCEYNTDSYGYDGDAQKAIYDTAIRSLQAWEKVLQEMEELKQEFKNDRRIHEAIAVNISIKRIKQKLAEIEE